MRHGLFVHRNQAAAQRRRRIGTAIGRTHHAAVQHARHAHIVHIGQCAQHLGRNVHALHGLADVVETAGAQRHFLVQRNIQVLALGQFAVADAAPALGHHRALGRGQCGHGLLQLLGSQAQQQLAHLRGGLAHGDGIHLDGVAGNGRALVGRAACVAQHHGDALELHIELIGHQLRQRGTDARAQIHVAVVGRDAAVRPNGDEAAHPVNGGNGEGAGHGRRRTRAFSHQAGGRHRADHDHAAQLEQVAARQLKGVGCTHAAPPWAISTRARAAARMISTCVPQRHRWPDRAWVTSSSVAVGLWSNKATRAMTMPLVQ